MFKKNFTRKDLYNKIYKNIGFSKNQSSKIIDDFFTTLMSEITKLNKVKISNFGTFSVLNKRERIGRNPKTGVEAKILARKVVKFKASLLLKNQINKNE